MTFCHLGRSNRKHILKKLFLFFFLITNPLAAPCPAQKTAQARAKRRLRDTRITPLPGKPQRPSPFLEEGDGALGLKQSPVSNEPWVLEGRALPLPGGEGDS